MKKIYFFPIAIKSEQNNPIEAQTIKIIENICSKNVKYSKFFYVLMSPEGGKKEHVIDKKIFKGLKCMARKENCGLTLENMLPATPLLIIFLNQFFSAGNVFVAQMAPIIFFCFSFIQL